MKPARHHPASDSVPGAGRNFAALSAPLSNPLSLTATVHAEIAALRRAVATDRHDAASWRRLADLLGCAGDRAGADSAHQQAVHASITDPQLVLAATALREGRLATAEPLLRGRLKTQPTDVAAIRMLAELASQIGRYADARSLLERALELSPGFDAARHTYALVLQRSNRPADALAQAETLLAKRPDDADYRLLKAAALVRLGEYGAAVAIYEELVRGQPGFALGWLSLGHALKTIGRADEAIAAYQRTLAIAPRFGEAWWSLANLKTFRFSADDIAAMRRALDEPALGDEERLHLHYALGTALEAEARDDAGAFAHFSRGAAIRRAQLGYVAQETTDACANIRTLFDSAFFAERLGSGAPDADPIFIVGMPRSGSTLIEQILASHPLVEGTMELPDLMDMAQRLRRHPGELGRLDSVALRRLGDEYLERTRAQRKTSRPFFIDKMPNNWMHVGLIRLILPNAKIIDARRHPLACCFANFKQHFARGQGFSYDLTDLGRYYRDYAALMAHFDEVLPGRVHRVGYELMVTDTEAQIRSLLQYCGLPFDSACLRFHETERAVRTPSAEQVRQPIYTSGLDQWRRFEAWLEPAARALKEVTVPTGT